MQSFSAFSAFLRVLRVHASCDAQSEEHVVTQPENPRVIPVVVVLPPRALLLDVAGPIEVLRRANLLQDGVRFDVVFAGPARSLRTSIGLAVTDIEPLPRTLPAGAMIVIAGNVAQFIDRSG